MINTRFEAYKVRRELKKSGKVYEFNRTELNDFKEPTGKENFVGKLTGLYHEQNGYVSVSTGDTTRTRTKKVPMLLCLYGDANFLKVDDIVRINLKTFKVTGIVNVQEWNIIADISLEVVDDGIQT